ncbi:hypothetical protein EYF80_016794 [Liparis tanakae]|uniref:Uncharacterized protein n=1 Tax=Liparis tanakae TaxID=230148 RepID=A0A4Z2I6R1_9TELE|nr:hypothetical protein EYF80_016794 [Liparis tanakae]
MEGQACQGLANSEEEEEEEEEEEDEEEEEEGPAHSAGTAQPKGLTPGPEQPFWEFLSAQNYDPSRDVGLAPPNQNLNATLKLCTRDRTISGSARSQGPAEGGADGGATARLVTLTYDPTSWYSPTGDPVGCVLSPFSNVLDSSQNLGPLSIEVMGGTTRRGKAKGPAFPFP